jgi:hypothetical protein
VQCKKKKRDGVRCRANALSSQKFCALHSELGRAQSLSSKYATADQLYQMALKGEFEHYPRSRQWCGSGDMQAPKP